MKTLRFFTLSLFSLTLLFTSCQKESISSETPTDDHFHEDEINIEDAPSRTPDFSSINFTVENGILSFPTYEDVQNYTKNIAYADPLELELLEQRIGFNSWLHQRTEILEQAKSINNYSQLQSFVNSKSEFVQLSKDKSLSIVPQPNASIVNKDKMYKVVDAYYYITTELVIIANSLNDLDRAISDINFTTEGVYRTDMKVENFASQERTDGVTGSCHAYSNTLFGVHYYPHGTDNANRRLTLDVHLYTFFNPFNMSIQNVLDYSAKNEVQVVEGNIIRWRLQNTGMLTEYRLPNVHDHADVAYVAEWNIEHLFFTQEAVSLSDYDWIMTSIWNPDWHRVGCRI